MKKIMKQNIKIYLMIVVLLCVQKVAFAQQNTINSYRPEVIQQTNKEKFINDRIEKDFIQLEEIEKNRLR